MAVLHIPKSEVTQTSSQHTYQPCLVPQEVYMSTSTFEIHQVPIYFDFTHRSGPTSSPMMTQGGSASTLTAASSGHHCSRRAQQHWPHIRYSMQNSMQCIVVCVIQICTVYYCVEYDIVSVLHCVYCETRILRKQLLCVCVYVPMPCFTGGSWDRGGSTTLNIDQS